MYQRDATHGNTKVLKQEKESTRTRSTRKSDEVNLLTLTEGRRNGVMIMVPYTRLAADH